MLDVGKLEVGKLEVGGMEVGEPNRQKRAKICKPCGKEGPSASIKQHIEANHLEGVTLPCNLCDKIFRSRKVFRMHISRNHKHH